MFCRKCGNQIPDDSDFCFKCGAKVDLTIKPPSEPAPAAVSLEKPVPKVEATSRRCEFCGKEVFSNEEKCSRCNAPNPMYNSAHTPPRPVSSRSAPSRPMPEQSAPEPAVVFEYHIDLLGNLVIDNYVGKSSSVAIPERINGRIVSAIGDNAFDGNGFITEVTIPDGATSIGYCAFRRCVNLVRVTIPEGVTDIGSSAFSFCESLTEITIPKYITSIGPNTFCGCKCLSKVTIFYGMRLIDIGAFSNCESLTSITIPNSVRVIGNQAFANCTQLRYAAVSDKTKYSETAFSNCPNVKIAQSVPQNDVPLQSVPTQTASAPRRTASEPTRVERPPTPEINSNRCRQCGKMIYSNQRRCYSCGCPNDGFDYRFNNNNESIARNRANAARVRDTEGGGGGGRWGIGCAVTVFIAVIFVGGGVLSAKEAGEAIAAGAIEGLLETLGVGVIIVIINIIIGAVKKK